MAIEIQETFAVAAPIDAVWRFMLDPQQVVMCMPGAELDEVVDERTFLGSVKVKVGAITTRYKGRIQFAEVDAANHSVRMLAEGRETGGGTAKGSVTSRLRALDAGRTEVVTEASVDLTGRIMQVGRGMIQGVSHQLFLQFVASTRQRLETAGAEVGAQAGPGGAPVQTPIRVVPLVLRVIWESLARCLRRLFGRRAG